MCERFYDYTNAHALDWLVWMDGWMDDRLDGLHGLDGMEHTMIPGYHVRDT